MVCPRAKRVVICWPGESSAAARTDWPSAVRCVRLYPRPSTANGLSDSIRPATVSACCFAWRNTARTARNERTSNSSKPTPQLENSLKWAAKHGVPGDRFKTRPGRLGPRSQGGSQATFNLSQIGNQLFGGWGDKFGRFARRQRTHIGGQIGKRHVDLMANR